MNTEIQDLLSKLPIDAIAARVGEDPAAVRAAIENLLPTLLAGMGANAQDPAGRDSLASAVVNHDPSLVEGDVAVDAIDEADGAKIASHVFGANTEEVTTQLGAISGGSGLVRKLLPILAPLVMSWLAGRMRQGGDTTGSTGGLLEQVLSQALAGSSSSQQDSGLLDGILGQVLGGLLGRGRR